MTKDIPPVNAPIRKRVILIALSGGGFTSETKSLLGSLRSDVAFRYLAAPWAGSPGEDDVPPGACHKIPAFDSFTSPSILRNAWAFLATLLTACIVLLRSRVDLVVGVGSRHALPMLLGAGLFGRRTVFIESLARVERLSRVGVLVYYLHLSTVFIVQWPALQRQYPRSRLGSLL